MGLRLKITFFKQKLVNKVLCIYIMILSTLISQIVYNVDNVNAWLKGRVLETEVICNCNTNLHQLKASEFR